MTDKRTTYQIDDETIKLLEHATSEYEICVREPEKTWSGNLVTFNITRAPDPKRPWHNYNNGGSWYSSQEVKAEPR